MALNTGELKFALRAGGTGYKGVHVTSNIMNTECVLSMHQRPNYNY